MTVGQHGSASGDVSEQCHICSLTPSWTRAAIRASKNESVKQEWISKTPKTKNNYLPERQWVRTCGHSLRLDTTKLH